LREGRALAFAICIYDNINPFLLQVHSENDITFLIRSCETSP
jgi:hypothetical protein